MTDEQKSKEQLIRELEDLRMRFNELSASEAQLRATREDLRDSETRFRSVAQSAVDAIISANTRDEIIFWNKAATAIFGYTEAEALGKHIAMLMPESHREAHSQGIARYLKTGVPALIGKTLEVPALRKDGVEFPIELSLSAWNAKGETFFSGIIRDVSERKEAERLLKQRTEEASQRTEELESLIQMVAHDLKSPIITIAGLTRLLKKNLCSVATDAVTEKLLSQLEASSATVETFLKDLLDGLAAEAAMSEQSPIRIDKLIREVTDQHKERLEERRIALEIEIPDSIPAVMGDLRRLKQVLENLLGNAIRYIGSTSEPRIRVQAGHGAGMVVISVSDNGIGIASEFQDKIFERFFRAPTSGVSGGTGLGLSIVKKIVKHHGGAVWVESEEGMGSTFSFSLPVCGPGTEEASRTRN